MKDRSIMFQCLKHGWTSAEKPCLACHPPKPKLTAVDALVSTSATAKDSDT